MSCILKIIHPMLNAWLKELDIEYKWIEKENEDWATLIISGFGLHE